MATTITTIIITVAMVTRHDQRTQDHDVEPGLFRGTLTLGISGGIVPGGASRTPECGFDATNWLWVTLDRGIQRWAGSSPDYNRSFNGFCASVHVTISKLTAGSRPGGCR